MVEINKDMLVDKKKEIDVLDEILDSVSGGQSAGKRAVTNRLIESSQAQWDSIVSQVKEFLMSTPENPGKYVDPESGEYKGIEDDDQFAGVFAGLRQHLLADKELSTRFDSVLDSKAEEIKANTPNYTEEQIKTFSEDRRAKVKEFNTISELLGLFSVDIADIEKPKRRTGAHGKRGPRAISNFTWEVDGVRMPQKEDSLTGVASANDYDSVKELKEALTASGVDLKVPGEEITFKMKNDKVLHGTSLAQKPVEEDEDDEDEDDDETDVEEVEGEE